jgi:hypothetical protein
MGAAPERRPGPGPLASISRDAVCAARGPVIRSVCPARPGGASSRGPKRVAVGDRRAGHGQTKGDRHGPEKIKEKVVRARMDRDAGAWNGLAPFDASADWPCGWLVCRHLAT